VYQRENKLLITFLAVYSTEIKTSWR
jgi:hypothetical protein